MVPAGLDGYLTATSAAAGALIGLLFVAVSLRPAAVFGPTAPRRNRMIAESAFIALVNPFMLSLWALLPHARMGAAAALLGVIALLLTLYLHSRLSYRGSRVLLAFSFVGYGLQLGCACLLLARPHDAGVAEDLAGLMLVSLSLALARAWTLMRALALDPLDDAPEIAA